MQRSMQSVIRKGEEFIVIDMNTEEHRSMTCQAFFKAYEQGFATTAQEDGQKGDRQARTLLKLKDFPPSQTFMEALPRHGQVCPLPCSLV
jgi:hypothetical protein